MRKTPRSIFRSPFSRHWRGTRRAIVTAERRFIQQIRKSAENASATDGDGAKELAALEAAISALEGPEAARQALSVGG